MPARTERNGNRNGRPEKPKPARLGFFLRRKAVSAERRLSAQVADVQLLEKRLAGEENDDKRNALQAMLGLRRKQAASAIRREMPALEEMAGRLEGLQSEEAERIAQKIRQIIEFGQN